MIPRQPLRSVIVALALIAESLAGCTVVPAATPSQAAAVPTDTVVYGVPTAPSPASPGSPAQTTSPATGETVPVAPPATTTPSQGTPAGGRLTILHTNDTRGWLDPCG